MPILDLQRRIAEIGRIRIGQQVANTKGRGTRPVKLTTFRLTSSDRLRIQHAAAMYGGQIEEWDAPSGKQWEVITESDALNIIVPPSDMSFSQHYELWAAGGCERRCDGVSESISQGPCVCDPDKRECQVHTRLSVMLRDLPGLGVWRIDTSGYYAAVELQGAVEVVQMAAGRGQMLPARLRLEQRSIKRKGSSVKRFAVPVLDIEVSPAQLLGAGAPVAIEPSPQRAALGGQPGPNVAGPVGQNPRELAPPPAQQPARAQSQQRPPEPVVDGSAPLTPVPNNVPEHPVASVAEQAAAEKPRRKSSQQPIPRTGIKPRTASQAAAAAAKDDIPLPPEPPADEPPPPARKTNTVPIDGPNDREISPQQMRMMHALFNQFGITDRGDRLSITSHIIGRDIDTSNQLTVGDATQLIDILTAWSEGHDGAGEQINVDDVIREVLNTAFLKSEGAASQENS